MIRQKIAAYIFGTKKYITIPVLLCSLKVLKFSVTQLVIYILLLRNLTIVNKYTLNAWQMSTGLVAGTYLC